MTEDTFQLLPTEASVRERFNLLFKQYHLDPSSGQHNFFQGYQQLLDTLNGIMAEPPSVRKRQNTAFSAKTHYNDLLESSKEVLAKTSPSYLNEKKIVGQLAQRKRMFDNQLKRFEQTVVRRQRIHASLEPAYWEKLLELAQTCDNPRGRREALSLLRDEWQAQGNLADLQTRDLIIFESQLQKLSEEIEAIRYALHRYGNPQQIAIDAQILQNLDKNSGLIENYRQCLSCAYGWRLEATSVTRELACGDALVALKYRLKRRVFRDANDEVLAQVTKHSQENTSLEEALTFDDFVLLQDRVMRSQSAFLKAKWFNSYWANQRDSDLVPVVQKAGIIVPEVIADYVPDTLGYWIGDYIRHYYFMPTAGDGSLAARLQSQILGGYPQTATLISETSKLLDRLGRDMNAAKRRSEIIDMSRLSKSYAFRAALEIPQFIVHEEERSSRVKPAWYFGKLLRARTHAFYEKWFNTLATAKSTIDTQCKEICSKIMEDFEEVLISGLRKQQITLSKRLIYDLRQFVAYYGTDNDKRRLMDILDPLMIVNRTLSMVTDPEVIDTLDHYAKINWTPEEQAALPSLIALIDGTELPTSKEAEDTVLYPKLQVLFTGELEHNFQAYLRHVAITFVFRRGDDFNQNTLAFLERHAPEKAAVWIQERPAKLDAIFVDCKRLFDTVPEVDLSSIAESRCNSTSLALIVAHPNYRDAMSAEIANYVRKYQGDNLHYLRLLRVIDDSSVLVSYVNRRLEWLIAQEKAHETTLEDSLLAGVINASPQLVEAMLRWIDETYDGDTTHLHAFVETLNNPEITAAYFIKYLAYLINQNDLETVNQIRTLYAELLDNNSHFNNEFSKLLVTLIASLPPEFNLLDSNLIQLVESVPNESVQDAYYLKRIEAALINQDMDDALELMHICRRSESNQWVQTFDAKRKLMELFEFHQAQSTGWNCVLQALMETEMPTHDKTLLHAVRYAWLEDFLENPQRYTNSHFLRQPTLFQYVHQRNHEVPSDHNNLLTFFGDDIVCKFVSLLMKKLEPGLIRVSDQGLRLIERYVGTEEMRDCNSNVLLGEMLKIYKTVSCFYYQLNHEQYLEAVATLEMVATEVAGLIALEQKHPDPQRVETLTYLQHWYQKMQDSTVNYVKNLSLDPRLVNLEDLTEYAEIAVSSRDKRQRVTNLLLKNSHLSPVLKSNIRNIVNAPVTAEMMEFVRQFTLDGLTTFVKNLSALRALQSMLSWEMKHVLQVKIRGLLKLIPNTDPHFAQLSALKDYFSIDNPDHRTLEAAIEKIGSAVVPDAVVADWKVQWTDGLIHAIQNDLPLSEIPLLSDEHQHSFQTFRRYVDSKSVLPLSNTLYEKLSSLLDRKLLIHHRGVAANLPYYHILYRWCLQLGHDSKLTTALPKELENVYARSNTLFDTFITFLSQVNSTVVSSLIITDVFRNELLHNATLMVMFGQKSQKDRIQENVESAWHCIAPFFVKPSLLTEHEGVVDYVTQLVLHAGEESFKENCQYSIELLNKLRAKRSNSVLGALRASGYVDAIAQYVKEIDSKIYLYFIKKHHLTGDFSDIMRKKLIASKWMGKRFDLKAMQESYDSSEWLSLLNTAPTVRSAFNIFHISSNPTNRDAKKLFVAYCLQVQAHLLHSFWKDAFDNTSNMEPFKLEDLSTDLIATFETLMNSFNVGRYRFNRSMLETIKQNSALFVSWSPEDPNVGSAGRQLLRGAGLGMGLNP